MLRSFFGCVISGAAVLVVGATTAVAEPALVRGGAGEGQGWVFKLRDECWVATARHVVEGSDEALVVGPSGAQGQAIEVWRSDEKTDLALIRLAGSLASNCPASSLGDRDSRPALRAAINQGRAVAMERRLQSGTGDLFGTDIVAMDVIAVPETQATFTLRPTQPDLDPVMQSDSGSPVRLRGVGIGESGLPLGLVVSVEGNIVTAVRMDIVRAAAESIASSSVKPDGSSAKPAAMSITHFTGDSPFPECGPLNLLRVGAPCGWRVKKSGRPGVQISFEFEDARTEFGLVTLTFAPGFAPRGVSVATRVDGQPVDSWSADRYCRHGGDTVLSCELGERTAAGLRLTFDGDAFELMSVAVD